jgi:hypothetical protein
VKQFRSFLGFNEAGHARVCAYCADQKAATAHARSCGLEVSHGICPAHLEIEIRAVQVAIKTEEAHAVECASLGRMFLS